VHEKTGKKIEDVDRYMEIFFARISDLENSDQLIQRLERAEVRNAKRDIYNDLIKSKISKYSMPEISLTFEGLRRIGDSYTDSEDRGILLLLAKVGYGFWDQLKDEVNKSYMFRNNWFLRTRTCQELQNRCERLIRCIEREFEQLSGKGDIAPSGAMIDEKVPDCWYDGNTSESDTEGNNEVSQNRLARVANTESAKPKRKRNSQSIGVAGKRKISLKLPDTSNEDVFPNNPENPPVEDTIMSSDI
jgi:hypothetical protein